LKRSSSTQGCRANGMQWKKEKKKNKRRKKYAEEKSVES
jgi:hypothetical protein